MEETSELTNLSAVVRDLIRQYEDTYELKRNTLYGGVEEDKETGIYYAYLTIKIPGATREITARAIANKYDAQDMKKARNVASRLHIEFIGVLYRVALETIC